MSNNKKELKYNNELELINQKLNENHSTYITRNQIEALLNCTKPTALKIMTYISITNKELMLIEGDNTTQTRLVKKGSLSDNEWYVPITYYLRYKNSVTSIELIKYFSQGLGELQVPAKYIQIINSKPQFDIKYMCNQIMMSFVEENSGFELKEFISGSYMIKRKGDDKNVN